MDRQNGQPKYRRRVGTARPSHLMFTGGVGALIDLPNFAVLVRGIDDWKYDNMPDWAPLAEPRLVAAVRRLLGSAVEQLRPPPWIDGNESDPNDPSLRVGVPVLPFPQWMRCTACNVLAGLDSRVWGFANDKARRPDEARFYHENCRRKKGGKKPLAVAARFVLACADGHLDDFPYVSFVHRGDACPEVSHPTLEMQDFGGNQGANVRIRCTNCQEQRNIREAMGKRGDENLPRCRGRHPHLGVFEPDGCERQVKLIVVGASNQWFSQSLTALAVPEVGASAVAAEVSRQWENLQHVTGPPVLHAMWQMPMPQFAALKRWSVDQVWDAIEARHRELEQGESAREPYPDLRTPEWQVFTAEEPPEPTSDFTLRRDPDGVPKVLSGLFADVVQAERLREVRALVGFTRLDAPDPDAPDFVTRAPIARDQLKAGNTGPSWVPGSEVRGEGIFVRLPEDLIGPWEEKVRESGPVGELFEAYKRNRTNRYSDRLPGDFDPSYAWPGPRYIALHTLSHLLIRTIALECGYNAASLSERIYSSTEEEKRAGILIYTAVPDAEGTLGGLVSLGEREPLERIVRRAIGDAQRCSSDPLCAERLPHAPEDFLHGAACHACLFVSETTCERGNRFLDRRFVVPIDDSGLALLRELP